MGTPAVLAYAILAVKAYLVLGASFAIWFAARGAGRLDPVAVRGSVGFRTLILPGAVLLWPLLLLRVRRAGPAPPEERNAHRDAAHRAAGR